MRPQDSDVPTPDGAREDEDVQEPSIAPDGDSDQSLPSRPTSVRTLPSFNTFFLFLS